MAADHTGSKPNIPYFWGMIDLIKSNMPQIENICAKHHVKSLALFGSAAKGAFDHHTSDLDFVVEFNNTINPLEYADNFFSLLDALRQLFQTDIDLLSATALRNRVLIAEINDSKIQLYAA
jgi:hypothetical protein